MLAFVRRDGERCIVVIATRLFASLGLQVGQAPIGAVWGDTVVEPPADGALLDAMGPWPATVRLTDSLSGREHVLGGAGWPLADLLHDFPLALLAGSTAPGG